jgi:hypothetical protein
MEQKSTDWGVSPELARKIEPETVDYYLREGEQALKERSEVGHIITDRAYRVLSILIAVLSALTAFLFSTDYTCKQAVMAIIAGVALFAALMFVLGLIFPRKTFSLGSEPKRFVTEMWINDALRGGHQIKALKINKIGILQNAIKAMERQNTVRAQMFRVALIILSGAFAIEAIAAFAL